MQTYNASVRVMRSYDYCHFEICLGVSEGASLESVDEIRKQAARLADKAVEQYKRVKATEDRKGSDNWTRRELEDRFSAFKDKPESEWTPREQAIAKCRTDAAYWKRRSEYDYEESEWVDEYALAWSDDEDEFSQIPF